jgi:GNAT superfamily N-acetyltransferase
MSLRVEPIPRERLGAELAGLAALRIRVFAEFPYLYDGDADYEARYLRTYQESEAAIVVGAWDGARLVGAATGTPMEEHAEALSAAFAGQDISAETVFYCAESVLLPEYRGRGAGARFFELREAHARELGRRWSAFCAVIRPEDHPDKPADHRPLHGLWARRGYRKLPGAIARFRWKDHRDAGETEKSLQFWIRDLEEDPR